MDNDERLARIHALEVSVAALEARNDIFMQEAPGRVVALEEKVAALEAAQKAEPAPVLPDTVQKPIAEGWASAVVGEYPNQPSLFLVLAEPVKAALKRHIGTDAVHTIRIVIYADEEAQS